jgi:hypothetical protein
MKYSRQQIALMARSAGWGKQADNVAWVAMAESSGDASAVNSIGAVGLLQINQPVHVGSHPKWTVSWLKDPINNLEAGLVLYKAAGNKYDGPWLDSRDKGGGGGWGQHVSGSGATQASDSFGSSDPLEDFWNKLLGKPKRGPGSEDYDEDPFGLNDTLGLSGLQDTATQLGRMAQAIAKAGNWMSDPANWVRVAYVTGGALLVLTAVATVSKPYVATAANKISGVMPSRILKK